MLHPLMNKKFMISLKYSCEIQKTEINQKCIVVKYKKKKTEVNQNRNFNVLIVYLFAAKMYYYMVHYILYNFS